MKMTSYTEKAQSIQYTVSTARPGAAQTSILSLRLFMINSTFKSTSNFFNPVCSIFNPFSLFIRRNHFQTTVPQPYNGYPDEQLHNILHKCIKAQTIKALRSFHALTIILGSYARQPIYFANNVISLYSSLDELQNARSVFDEMPERNGVSYNALISAYSRHGLLEDAWEMFCHMCGCGLGPTRFTFGALLSCPGLDIRKGCLLHGLMLKNGLFFSDPHAGTALLGMLGRHECVDEAVRVFNDMRQKSLVTWNSMISVLGCHGLIEESVDLFCRLLRSESSVSGSTVVGLLSGLGALEAPELGRQLHCLVIKNGLHYDASTSNALLNMCVKFLDLSSAEQMFHEAHFRDVVTYNTLIGALAKGEKPDRGLKLFLCLLTRGALPNMTTYIGVINCCAKVQLPIIGEYIHAKVIKNSFNSNVYVGSTLVDFYGKCNMLDSARCCFDEMLEKNVVSWNSLIVAFTSNTHTTSYALFKEMLQLAYCPNEFTFSAVLKASSAVELQQLHCLVIRTGYVEIEYVVSALMTSYARNGLLSDALLIAISVKTPISVVCSNVLAATYNKAGHYEKSLETLSKLNDLDIISWNILVSTCSHNGHYIEAFELFKHMLEIYIYPDKYTMASVLSCCTSFRCLTFGSSVHGLMIKTSFPYCDTLVCNILIDMYGKCGNFDDSTKIFEETMDKNLITWTTIVSALGHHGFAHQALKRFKEMELLRVKPDAVSFVAVLSACRHGGLVAEGMELFSTMQKEYQIEPKVDHYHGVVDLLARYGHLKESEQVINSMPFPPNALIWRSFLDGCKRWMTSEFFLRRQST